MSRQRDKGLSTAKMVVKEELKKECFSKDHLKYSLYY
jgi:hypothetical protein